MTPHDLDAYLARIGYTGARQPTLAVLHALTAAHTRAIPFENIDVLLARPIDLALDALIAKLVHARRGGYCFEQNGLLLHVLATLGFAVVPLSARVRLQRPRDYTPARTHVFARVELDGESWLADVGVGALSPSAALRLELDVEQATLHEPRRLIRHDGRFFHQVRFGADWQDVCEFTLEEMPPIDREVGNWFTSASPQSHFKNRLIVARAGAPGERLTIADKEFTIRRDGVPTTRAITSEAELFAILDEHFGIRLAAGTQLAVPGSPWT